MCADEMLSTEITKVFQSGGKKMKPECSTKNVVVCCSMVVVVVVPLKKASALFEQQSPPSE